MSASRSQGRHHPRSGAKSGSRRIRPGRGGPWGEIPWPRVLALALGAAAILLGAGWRSSLLGARPARNSAGGPGLSTTASDPDDSIGFENPISGDIGPGETRTWRTASLAANGFYSI